MIKKLIIVARNFLLDFYDTVTGKRNSMVPPRHMVNINAGNDEKIQKKFLKLFKDPGGLKSTDNVLDVGSGYGRMAVALTDYLSPDSRYEGIEILKKGVDWCTKRITPKYNNFNFSLIDVKNDRYNPNGKTSASEYKFPFASESFDFVFLVSVFTHLLPADLENYLSEISRVLNNNGRCFITFFLLNEFTNSQIEKGKASYTLKFKYQNCRIESEDNPEWVIAYEEKDILKLFHKYGLTIDSVNYGGWTGRENCLSNQDIIVGKKIKNTKSS